MASLLSLAVFGASVAHATLTAEDVTQQAFFAYIKEFKKQYATEEVFVRYSAFKANLALIEKHNSGNHGWEMGINQFTDLTNEEFKAQLGLRPRPHDLPSTAEVAPWEEVGSPDIDWVAKGAVTAVGEQGACGSCWAFSVTGAIEGAVKIATGRLTALSNQQLMDCSTDVGNEGCNGGDMIESYKWVIQHKGLGSDASYPYIANDGPCKNVTSVSTIAKYAVVQKGSESALMSALTQQPVSIAVEADANFQNYKSGVYKGPCGSNLSHSPLLVGAGTDKGVDYWTVKNSWGTAWGEKGYIRMIRGQNICGISNYATFVSTKP